MTRAISDDLLAHFQQEVTTVNVCWLLTRTDSVVMGFTDCDEDIIFDGVTYYANTGITPSTNKSNCDMSVDNMEADSILNSDFITEADISAGLYDFAAIEVFLVNRADVSMGSLIIRTGTLGEITIDKGKYTVEMRGMVQQLTQSVGRIISPLCDANFGDSRCTLSLTAYTFTATVTSVTDNGTFFATGLTQAINYFSNGRLTWTSGSNNGRSIEVKGFVQTQVILSLSMGYDIQIGDTFTIVAGCDKTSATCLNTFNNLINFRGFPDVPGMNAILTTSGTFQAP